MFSIDFNQFYRELKTVLENPRPWMHARYGDGEGIVLGYPEFTSSKSADDRWRKWLGPTNIDKKIFAILIRESVLDCDIVGIPCKRHMTVNQNWRNVSHFLHKFNLITQSTCCCMDCVIELQTKDLFKTLLTGRKELYCISCRDLSSILEKRFKIKYVETFPLPPQYRPFKGEILIDQKHYPALFNLIPRWLDSLNLDDGHKLVLVGAGGLGKIYCSYIKQRGGIALDVGSLFDGWAGLITRSYLNNINKFKL